jgi:hypothetical protein
MLFSFQYRALAQLFTLSLHTFLLGIFVLASTPQLSDRAGDYRPARDSRLAALHAPIEGTALNREVKRRDVPSWLSFLAPTRFRQAQVQRAARLSFPIVESSYQRPPAGALSIRSPPLQISL